MGRERTRVFYARATRFAGETRHQRPVWAETVGRPLMGGQYVRGPPRRSSRPVCKYDVKSREMSSHPGRHAPLSRAGADKRSGRQALDDYLSFWRYSRRAITLVWSTHRTLTIALGLLTIAAGLMPAAVA